MDHVARVSDSTVFERIRILDTHTGGEPTRVVLDGGPDLGSGPIRARCRRFRERFDAFRKSVVHEPRGFDAMVGALLCEPADTSCVAGVIFFNNVGALGMCGHGTIGVAVALAHAGRIDAGDHALETPVGRVPFCLHADRRTVTLENVPSYRLANDVAVEVPGHGRVAGDVAWGGNWFFLVKENEHRQELVPSRIDALTRFSLAIRRALDRAGITGRDGVAIDHVELFAPTDRDDTDSRSFVLCPGGEFDRSPCGTGTSAKLACLAADGLLAPGDVWRQESIIGSVFAARYRAGDGDTIIPEITGDAWVVAEATLLVDPADPLRAGISYAG